MNQTGNCKFQSERNACNRSRFHRICNIRCSFIFGRLKKKHHLVCLHLLTKISGPGPMTGVFGEADRYLSLQIPLLQKPVDKLAFLFCRWGCVFHKYHCNKVFLFHRTGWYLLQAIISQNKHLSSSKLPFPANKLFFA